MSKTFAEMTEEEQIEAISNCQNLEQILYGPSSLARGPRIPVTKSTRYNQGKPQSNEIDPAFILGIAKVLTKSREKYDRANWIKSTSWEIPYDCLMRHIMAFQSGEDFDKESGNHHLLHAATNLMFLYYYVQTQPENDSRIFKKEVK